MKRLTTFAAIFGLTTLFCLGCDKSESTSGDEEREDVQALKIIAPSTGSTPRAEIAFRVQPLKESEIEAAKQPIGNALYLALRACDDIHPSEGAANVIAVQFEVDGGVVTNVEKREARVQGEGEPVGESGRACVFDELRDTEVEFPDDVEFGERTFRVDAQTKLSR